MRNATTFSADQVPVSHETLVNDASVRDDVVPQLARRVRRGRSTWVVYLKASGVGSKVTLGAYDSMPVARARDIAAAMVAKARESENASLGPPMTSGDVSCLRDFAEISFWIAPNAGKLRHLLRTAAASRVF